MLWLSDSCYRQQTTGHSSPLLDLGSRCPCSQAMDHRIDSGYRGLLPAGIAGRVVFKGPGNRASILPVKLHDIDLTVALIGGVGDIRSVDKGAVRLIFHKGRIVRGDGHITTARMVKVRIFEKLHDKGCKTFDLALNRK